MTPGVRDLPPPPAGAKGWPWTEGTPADAGGTAPGLDWPRISIVTPSFHQAAFLERTLRSVLLQGYSDLEYLVIDGGSKDGSVEIIERYAPWISYWVSEPDRGQSHAINKGLARTTGEILGWLNSDDWLMPGALRVVAEKLRRGTGHFALVGGAVQENVETGRVTVSKGEYGGRLRLLQFWKGYRMHQPSIFWRREVMDAVGLLDENQHYVMDFDYWFRMAKSYDFVTVDIPLSGVHKHMDAKTWDGGRRWREDLIRERHRYWADLPLRARVRLHASFWAWRFYQAMKLTEKRVRRAVKGKVQ